MSKKHSEIQQMKNNREGMTITLRSLAIQSLLIGSCLLFQQTAFSEDLAPLVNSDAASAPSSASAPDATNGSDPLTSYEQKLLMTTHTGEPMSERVARLEAFIYGEPQSGSLEERQARLLQVLQNTAPEAAQRQNASEPDEAAMPDNRPPVVRTPPPVEKPDATDYPTVTTMEENVFGHNFRQENITNRLARLENKIFGNIFPNMQLVDRVDNLLSRAPSTPQTKAGRQIFDRLPEGNTQFASPNSSDIYLKLDALERAMLNGKTNTGKLLSERIDILEKMSFGSTMSAESMDNRVNRLITNFENLSGGGAPYQNRPQVMNRPPVQQRDYSTPPGTSYGPSSQKPSQNIRIGSTFGSNSQYQYSQDLLDMLPNDVRSQMQGPGPVGRGPAISSQSSSSSGFTASAPGSVIIQETHEYSGFPMFNGNTITQSRNLYSGPGTFSQSSQSYSTLPSIGMPPAIVNSYPTVNPYAQPGGIPQYGYQNGYNTAPYGMDPVLNQQLNTMEMGVFGQVNPYAPVQARLNQLEASMLGQNYAGYSLQDRMNNLQRAYQLQSVGKNLGNGKLGKVGRTAGSLLYGIPMPSPIGQ